MEANLFIKKYKTEGNKIKELQFYGDMEVDIGNGGSGSSGSSDKYHYATGKILFDKIDGFITPVKVDDNRYFMIQVPADSYLYVGYKKVGSDGKINHFASLYTGANINAIFLSGGTSYSIPVKTSGWYGTNILLFSKDAFMKGYELTNTFIESLF